MKMMMKLTSMKMKIEPCACYIDNSFQLRCCSFTIYLICCVVKFKVSKLPNKLDDIFSSSHGCIRFNPGRIVWHATIWHIKDVSIFLKLNNIRYML